ncbi:MAG: hypothetical protein HN509_16920 [Halobacteriovoraceae bacterium]|nr:hypothetical protein [Halobacteriovoraceae bacterium]
MRTLLSLFLILNALPALASSFLAGASKVDITPTEWEERPYDSKNPSYKRGSVFYDTGFDRKFDYEENGAFGPDGLPGKAGWDDDQNGIVDDCSRAHCAEYMTYGTDDVMDPAGDNYNKKTNKNGTEADGEYQFSFMGGFAPYYPLWFIPLRTARNVHDPVWARAIAIQGSNGVPLIMITVDLPGLAWKYINPVKRRLSRETGIPFENIIISSTHNHYGPDASGYWVTMMKGHNKRYTDKLKVWMYEAGLKAWLEKRPAKMKSVTAEPVSCYNPKTKELKRGKDCNVPATKKEYQTGKFDEMIVQTDFRDPIVRNTTITASQYVDLETEKTIATFVNWHNHPDSMGEKQQSITSGFPKYIRDFVETKLGGITAYFSGTVGCQIQGKARTPKWNAKMERLYELNTTDINGNPVPVLERNGDKWQHNRSLGYEVGNEVVSSFKAKGLWETNPVVHVKSGVVDTEIDNFLHWLTTGTVWNFDVEKEDKMKHYLFRCSGRHGCVRTQLNIVQIGDLSLITSPGEIDPAYFTGRAKSVGHYDKKPKKIKFPAMRGAAEFLKGPHKAVLGQANGYLSYMVPKTDNVGWWRGGHPLHYEELVTVGKHFGDDVGNKWMQMLGSDYRYSKRKIHPTSRRLRRERRRKEKNLGPVETASEKKHRLGLFNKMLTSLLKGMDKSSKH